MAKGLPIKTILGDDKTAEVLKKHLRELVNNMHSITSLREDNKELIKSLKTQTSVDTKAVRKLAKYVFNSENLSDDLANLEDIARVIDTEFGSEPADGEAE